MTSLVTASQSAAGALQAAQAGNQLLALQSQQLSDLAAVLSPRVGRCLGAGAYASAEAQGQQNYRPSRRAPAISPATSPCSAATERVMLGRSESSAPPRSSPERGRHHALVVINRRTRPPLPTPPRHIVTPASDDLSASCAVAARSVPGCRRFRIASRSGGERQRFFGRPARPLPPQTPQALPRRPPF